MSSFTRPLLVEIQQGERNGAGLARLVAPFEYHVGWLGSGDVIAVPAGFVTDFCTVPRLARWLFSNFDRSAKAAVVHDFLITERRRSRRACDAVFLEALAVLGVPGWRRWIMWAAVRVHGLLTSRQ